MADESAGERPGYLLRFHGETHTVITTPTEKLETMSITGDEPNEFSFSPDGALAYVGHHGAMLTGSPSDQMHVRSSMQPPSPSKSAFR